MEWPEEDSEHQLVVKPSSQAAPVATDETPRRGGIVVESRPSDCVIFGQRVHRGHPVAAVEPPPMPTPGGGGAPGRGVPLAVRVVPTPGPDLRTATVGVAVRQRRPVVNAGPWTEKLAHAALAAQMEGDFELAAKLQAEYNEQHEQFLADRRIAMELQRLEDEDEEEEEDDDADDDESMEAEDA